MQNKIIEDIEYMKLTVGRWKKWKNSIDAEVWLLESNEMLSRAQNPEFQDLNVHFIVKSTRDVIMEIISDWFSLFFDNEENGLGESCIVEFLLRNSIFS